MNAGGRQKKMDRDFWKNRKVLVTGHTGFVGAWLCLTLKLLDADVSGFSLREAEGALFGKIKNGIGIRSFYGDIRDRGAITDCVKETNPDVVFHLAAFGFVKECYEDPHRAYSSNVQGSLNLFEGLRENRSTCRIIVASSDKVYKNTDLDMYLFREEDPLGGSDPYSASKTCEDLLAQSYYDSYLKNDMYSLCVVRPSNILGGGDHNMTRLIPSIYNRLQHGELPEIRNPVSVRPWQNIFDIIDAYLTVAERTETGCNIYNVGPEPEGIKTVGEIASYITGLYGVEYIAEKTAWTGSEVKEKAYLGLSVEKIRKELGWKPRRSLEQTLDEIYEFYSCDDGSNTYDLCVNQINRYYLEESNHAKLEQ